MSAIHSLVPARFLTLTAHLVIVITIFWSRDNNVRACLPLDFSQDEYRSQDTQLVVALSVTLGLFAIELAGFFSGVSMFNSTQSLLSIAAHASASVALLFFLFEQWSCAIYWWIFGFCSTGCPLQRLRVPVFLRLSAVGVLDVLVCVHLLQCSPCINGNPPLRFCLRPEKEATVRSLDRALVILSLTWLALRSHRETWAHKGPQESAGSLTMGYRIKVK
nr:transmembrane protein 107 isoform X3 [Paramormyrops kingsleyae]